MVEMEMAVDYGNHVPQPDAELREQRPKVKAGRPVQLIDESVPHADTGIDQKGTVRVVDEKAEHIDRSTKVSCRVLGR